jgi:transposase
VRITGGRVLQRLGHTVRLVRQGFVKARTAQANQIRGLLGEFGLIIPQGISHIAERVPALLEDASNELPVALRQRTAVELGGAGAGARDFGVPRSR